MTDWIGPLMSPPTAIVARSGRISSPWWTKCERGTP